MALVHDFGIVPNDYSESFLNAEAEKVSIPDDILYYIGDSLKWVRTIWNGKYESDSINYYGFSYIEGNNLRLLLEVVTAWRKLFSLSPDIITIRTGYLIDAKRYEYHSFQKEDILCLFDGWRKLCLQAINDNNKIMHIGI